MLIPVTAYVPFFKTIPDFLGERPQEYFVESRNAYINSLSPYLAVRNETIYDIEIEFGEPPEFVYEWLKERSFFNKLLIVDHLIITCKVDIDLEELYEINKVDSLDDTFLKHCAAILLGDALEDAHTLSELSHPGCITVLEGVITAEKEGVVHQLRGKRAFTELRIKEFEGVGWPDIVRLDLVDTYRWAKELGFSRKSYPDSRIGRALAAFSHVVGLGDQREGDVLFRAMQGLEAFYCDGKGDLRRQLSEKVRLWIGSWNDRKNIVGHLYDSRSAFVHGDSHIEFFGHKKDAWEENEKAKLKSRTSSIFAVRLLLRTLQLCVLSNTTEINWAFKIERNM